MKIIFIEDLPGLYAETFIIADSNKFKSIGFKVEHLYLSDLKIYWFSIIKNILFNPMKFIHALKFILKGVTNSRRFLSNCHALLLFLSNYNYLQKYVKNSSLRCHFLAKRFTFGFYCNLYFGTKYTGVAHAKDIFEWDNSIPKKISSSSHVDCISNFNIGYINGKTDFKFSKKLRLTRNLVLLDGSKSIKIKDKYKKQNSIRFISVCRLVEKKGLINCLNFLELLSHECEIFWTIIGDGPQYTSLLHQIKNSRIRKNVEVLGQKSQNFISENLDKSDYFILLPLNAESDRLDMDGIPTVFMEAINYNIPVITTSVSGIPELIINGVNGVLFESNISNQKKVELFLESHRAGFNTDEIKKSFEFFKKTGH